MMPSSGLSEQMTQEERNSAIEYLMRNGLELANEDAVLRLSDVEVDVSDVRESADSSDLRSTRELAARYVNGLRTAILSLTGNPAPESLTLGSVCRMYETYSSSQGQELQDGALATIGLYVKELAAPAAVLESEESEGLGGAASELPYKSGASDVDSLGVGTVADLNVDENVADDLEHNNNVPRGDSRAVASSVFGVEDLGKAVRLLGDFVPAAPHKSTAASLFSKVAGGLSSSDTRVVAADESDADSREVLAADDLERDENPSTAEVVSLREDGEGELRDSAALEPLSLTSFKPSKGPEEVRATEIPTGDKGFSARPIADPDEETAGGATFTLREGMPVSGFHDGILPSLPSMAQQALTAKKYLDAAIASRNFAYSSVAIEEHREVVLGRLLIPLPTSATTATTGVPIASEDEKIAREFFRMVQSQYAILSPALHVDLAKATPEDLLDLLGDNPADYIKDNDSEPAMGFADFGAVDEKEEAKKILGFYLATFHADAPGVIVALRPKMVTAKSAASAFHSGAGAGIVMRDETSTEHPIANTTIAMLDEPTDVVKNWKNNYAARWQAHLADLRVKYPPADGASSTEKYNVSPLTLHDVFHVTLDRASTKKNLVTVEDSGRTTLDGDACKEYGIELQEQANILVASFLVRYPPESRRSEMKIPTISGGNKKLNELIKTRLEEHYPAVRVVESAAATAEKAKDAIPLADRMSILNRGSGAVPGSDSTTKSNRTGSVPVGTDSPLRSAGGERTSPVKSTEAADSTVPTGSQLRR